MDTNTTLVEKKYNILVVDDEPAVGGVLTDFLTLKGLEVHNAASGQQALDILQTASYDLILLDLIMPGLNGAEVARIVRQKYPETKIVIITAFPKEMVKLQEGDSTDALFIKPFKLHDLYRKLEALHAQGTPAQEITESQLHTKTLYIKADIMLVGCPADACSFFERQLQELSLRGQYYDVRFARDENEFITQSCFCEPDIVIVEEDHYRALDSRTIDRVYLSSAKTKEILPFDTSAAQLDFSRAEELIEMIRSACIKHGLVQVG